MGSQSNLVGLANNQTFNRKRNTGALPTSAYALLGSYSASNLYYKLNPSSDDRNFTFSNHTNSNFNQGGFYGWTGGHNTYQWCSTPNQTVNTVAFYVK